MVRRLGVTGTLARRETTSENATGDMTDTVLVMSKYYSPLQLAATLTRK